MEDGWVTVDGRWIGKGGWMVHGLVSGGWMADVWMYGWWMDGGCMDAWMGKWR